MVFEIGSYEFTVDNFIIHKAEVKKFVISFRTMMVKQIQQFSLKSLVTVVQLNSKINHFNRKMDVLLEKKTLI